MTDGNKITVQVYEEDWWVVRRSKKRGETLADSFHRLLNREGKKNAA